MLPLFGGEADDDEDDDDGDDDDEQWCLSLFFKILS
jgi:hypothetical protein